jgi:hypothetical protein
MLFKLTQITFITLAIIFYGCQERQSNITQAGTNNNLTAIELDKANGGNLNKKQSRKEGESIITVYYFHRTARCVSCMTLEANVAQVIKNNFQKQIKDGTMLWMPFNLDDSGGEEFEKKFDITISTLVVAKIPDNNRIKYKKLEKVWQLLGDQEDFAKYVTDEINKFMNDK